MSKQGSCEAVVRIKKDFQSLNHQNKKGIRNMPKLVETSRSLASVDRRFGEDISSDIRVALCGADQEGNEAIMHPVAKNKKDELATTDITLPITSKDKDIIYVSFRPYLEKENIKLS